MNRILRKINWHFNLAIRDYRQANTKPTNQLTTNNNNKAAGLENVYAQSEL